MRVSVWDSAFLCPIVRVEQASPRLRCGFIALTGTAVRFHVWFTMILSFTFRRLS